MMLDLALTCLAHDLAHAFNHMAKATSQTRLTAGELTAIGVNRETTFVRCIGGFVKRTDLTFFHKSGIFEAHGREDSISIVKFSELHIFRTVPRHLKGPGG